MARCEDFPCCGHEMGCCPDYDEDTGRQLNMKCTCGATVDINSKYSICNGCLYGNGPAGSRYYDPYNCNEEY
jgi:hypothetical protein